ncbi:MAG: hypothetical protein B6D44_02035 [Ignavibacteriales bacterium UTCHB2]|jgi:hypothetical protein|nr:MAG: hypothetical protein B6D44_02035 [Ignavibacteriales bacterium UTCHB2]HQI41300.1 hypothetical protein [Ignavibacteriaceae bacterium]
MDKDYLSHIAEAKIKYHKKQAQIPYEEKFRIILELQKISAEMSRSSKNRKTNHKIIKVWQPE